jgi:hypothetical protein
MLNTNTMLVVSTDHVQDVWRARSDAIESFVAAVELFQPVLAVMDGPVAVEPLTSERPDITLAGCTNFRELVHSDAAKASMSVWLDANDRIHAGDRAAQATLSSAPLPPMRSRAANELFRQAFVTLARGWMGDDVDAILGHWEANAPVRVGADEREGIVAKLRGAAKLVPELRSLADDHGIDITEALRLSGASEAERGTRPGNYLALQVAGARRRNVTRKPRRSDLIDLAHAMHFPYVDVATADAETIATVRSMLPKMTCPRQTVVVQNGHLDEVVATVRAAGPPGTRVGPYLR